MPLVMPCASAVPNEKDGDEMGWANGGSVDGAVEVLVVGAGAAATEVFFLFFLVVVRCRRRLE